MVFDPQKKYKKPQSKEQVKLPKDFDMFLPFPVSINAMYVPYDGGIYLSAVVKSYYAEVQDIIEREDIETLTGRLKAEIWVYEPNKIRRDINNITKTLFDALEKAKVYENDHQIDETYIQRCECVERGKVRVRITTICENDERLNIAQQKKIQKGLDKLEENRQCLQEMGVSNLQSTTKTGESKWKR